MKFTKKFELAWNTLIHSKLRSWLTIVGIIIGIAAVVAIVSISNGAQESMAERLNDMGTDQITITPGYTKASGREFGPGRKEDTKDTTTASDEDDPELTNKDVLAIESVDNVLKVAERISNKEEVVYSSKKSDVTIVGLEVEDFDILVDSTASEGRVLTKADTYSAVIGSRIADGVFEDMQLNRQITIADKTFRVVGILEEGGNSIYIPIDTAVNVLEDKEKNVYDSLTAVVEDPDLVENTTSDIEEKLMLTRGILDEKDQDFTVSNMISMQETISETLNAMALFLGAIAAISLLVGGIGIANTMFTSVLEKTKEIGIMKAIGTKNGDILSIFLINSGMIGLVGGLGGVILGSTASILIGNAGGLSGSGGGIGRMFSSTALSWQLILFALIFSIVIGMVAGLIPAYRASRLKPVDALRYE